MRFLFRAVDVEISKNVVVDYVEKRICPVMMFKSIFFNLEWFY